jgi:hypothetical protein
MLVFAVDFIILGIAHHFFSFNCSMVSSNPGSFEEPTRFSGFPELFRDFFVLMVLLG